MMLTEREEALDRQKRYFQSVLQDPDTSQYTDIRYRPDWMSDNQWEQMCSYMRGMAVPSDRELQRALSTSKDYESRAGRYVHSSIPALMVHESYERWCLLIRTRDPDLEVMEGL